jgi:hypothetical protein
MPASGTPFLLEICPAGLPAGMPAHHLHHHSGVHDHFENCPNDSNAPTSLADHRLSPELIFIC